MIGAWEAGSVDHAHPRVGLPCELSVRVRRDGSVAGTCGVHDCESMRGFATPAQAAAMFRCDRGRRWLFAAHWDGESAQGVLDLTGLCELVFDTARRARSGGEPSLQAWRLLPDGSRLELECELIITREGYAEMYVHAAGGPTSDWVADCDYSLDGATYLFGELLLDGAGAAP